MHTPDIGHFTAHGQPVPAAHISSIEAAIASRAGFNGFTVSQRPAEAAADPGERLHFAGLVGHQQAATEQAHSAVSAAHMTIGKRAAGARVIHTVSETVQGAGNIYSSVHAKATAYQPPTDGRVHRHRAGTARHEAAGTAPGNRTEGRHRRSNRLITGLGKLASRAAAALRFA